MFRITRGHHVQHIHFPLPVIRDLDDLESDETPADTSPEAAAPSAAEGRAEADPSTEAPQ
jgi:hypothetical protein